MSNLSNTQWVALRLIQSDLQFLFTVFQDAPRTGGSFPVALLPYFGMIIDGCESWGSKVPSLKMYTPQFSEDEKNYYSELRSSIKLWETPFLDLQVLLKQKYNESDTYFSECCKPIAKKLKLYDIFGTYLINGVFCDNKVLDMLFVPRFEYSNIDGEYIKSMYVVAGKMVASFGVVEKSSLEVDSSLTFENRDFGGFIKSPVGNDFSIKFVLFSMLCAINFILYGVDKYIISETSTKLRLAYIQYYYLLQQLPQINLQLGTQFQMDSQWVDSQRIFRNCMAHYGIGAALSQEEVNKSDLFGGLTDKLFDEDWVVVKNSIISELTQLSKKIEDYLKLK